MVILDFEGIPTRLDNLGRLELVQGYAVFLPKETIRQLVARQTAAQLLFGETHHLLLWHSARLE